MRASRIFGALAVGSLAIVAVPASVMSQSTLDKAGQTAKGAAHDATAAISDSWLTAKTKIALFADERVQGGPVSVETVEGAVDLRGKVDSEDAKAAAGSVAKAIDGVKSVKNDLQVVSPGARKAVDISDKDITRQVEETVSKDVRLKKVDVRTDGGVVMLTGAVGSISASARASEVARGVPGVRAVKNQLTYDPAKVDRPWMTARSHASVMAMQHALKDKGFDPGPVDGVAGPRTTSALKEYQKSQNLAMTGTLDDATAAKLGMTR
jgi:osmotically-inducible protein OsmY